MKEKDEESIFGGKTTRLEDLCKQDPRFGTGEGQVEIVNPQLLQKLRESDDLRQKIWQPVAEGQALSTDPGEKEVSGGTDDS